MAWISDGRFVRQAIRLEARIIRQSGVSVETLIPRSRLFMEIAGYNVGICSPRPPRALAFDAVAGGMGREAHTAV